TTPAREFLLREGTDLKYGARHLKRAIERHVVYPLASLLATEQVCLGDVISIDWDGAQNSLMFMKEAEGAVPPVASPVPFTRTAAASSDGRVIPVVTKAATSERFQAGQHADKFERNQDAQSGPPNTRTRV
ncbi:MAG TPA: hypothetical protein VJW93_14105, partial [Candidatus Acidoferrales bacterium]|nr:hypothetical protein [Candidatus Acidoferrales bacterium]